MINLIFGIIMSAMTAALIGSFVKDSGREECKNDEKFKSMEAFSEFIIILVSLSSFQVIVLAIHAVYRLWRAKNRR